MKKKSVLFVLAFFTALNTNLYPQISRLYMPRNIQQAYMNQTRSYNGTAGPRYWQNRADYKIDVIFDPQSLSITGQEKIRYINHSPDTLNNMAFHLFPDMYKKGNAHDYYIDPADQNQGVILEKLKLNGKDQDITSIHSVIIPEHTGFTLLLPSPLAPGKHNDITINWRCTINSNSHIRDGLVDSTSFFVAYFFPRIAVYDDIDGWNQFKYTGDIEFYNDFGNFELSITVPRNYRVWATGLLQNPAEVLTEQYLHRYQSAFHTDELIHIIDSTECTQNTITAANSHNTWKFKAENVTDVAFGTSNHYLWDATSMIVDKNTGRRVMIDAAYNKNSEDFYHVTGIAREAIHYMSTEIPGVPFPYPQETIFNGFGEMEYPMMVNNPSYNDFHNTFRIAAHEIFHSYFPFYTGCNETKYAWMDEGLTTFATYLMSEAIDAPEHAYLSFYSGYKHHIGHFIDAPVFIASDMLRKPTYRYNSYTKAASFFLILKDYLGDQRFQKALTEFINRWHGKHPTPYDLFFTFMDVSGENLDWIIKPWFFEFGYVDLAIQNVSKTDDSYRIIVEKSGRYPAHFDLKFTFTDGSTETEHYTISVWKQGVTQYEITKESRTGITHIDLIDNSLVDADKRNNVFYLK